ncbi:hypothetical protein WJX72_009845 [[Myrmecia] bisecta]|uniref:Uncharacterized protein n=1 Tax=[Myrmecia] bisecta TaxID=41462 RepID=A0AAW1QSH0_9CHLO
MCTTANATSMKIADLGSSQTAGATAPAPTPGPVQTLVVTLAGEDAPLNAGVVAEQMGLLVKGASVVNVGYVANVTLLLPGVPFPSGDGGGSVPPQLDLAHLIAQAVAAVLSPDGVMPGDVIVSLQAGSHGLLAQLNVGQAAAAAVANATLDAFKAGVASGAFDQDLAQLAANANVASLTNLPVDVLGALRNSRAAILAASLLATATVAVPAQAGGNPALDSIYRDVVQSGALATRMSAAAHQPVVVTGYENGLILDTQTPSTPIPVAAPAPGPSSSGHRAAAPSGAILAGAALSAAALLLLLL